MKLKDWYSRFLLSFVGELFAETEVPPSLLEHKVGDGGGAGRFWGALPFPPLPLRGGEVCAQGLFLRLRTHFYSARKGKFCNKFEIFLNFQTWRV